MSMGGGGGPPFDVDDETPDDVNAEIIARNPSPRLRKYTKVYGGGNRLEQQPPE